MLKRGRDVGHQWPWFLSPAGARKGRVGAANTQHNRCLILTDLVDHECG